MVRHLLLFDIDGTLLHADSAGRVALARALASEFGVDEPEIVVGFAGRTDRAIASESLSAHGIEPDPERFDRYLEAYLTHLPGTLEERNGHVYPGVPELLGVLQERSDVALAVLTGNFEGAARQKLSHFGLEEYFLPAGGFGDHHHDRDDVARAAEEALAAHVPDTATRWVIGDTPNDVRCARAIGARAIAVLTGFADRRDLEAAEPDHLLDDLTDARAFLALLDESR